MIYFTSDLHFCHNRDFLYEPRGFSDAEEMNREIIKRWNETVKYDDDVYILGDLMLNNNERGANMISQLNGNLHVICGNHDTESRIEIYWDLWNVVEVSYGMPFKYKGYIFNLTHYPTLCGNHDSDKPLNRRVISLCGHTHTQDKFLDMDKGLIYHVDMDAHNCTPVSIETIINDIKEYINER